MVAPGGHNGNEYHQGNPGGNGFGGQGVGLDLHHKRSDIRQLVRAAINGWLTPSQIVAAGRTLEQVMADDGADARARIAAAKGVIDVAKLAQQVCEFDDRTERLDSGRSTENVSVYEVNIPGVTGRGG